MEIMKVPMKIFKFAPGAATHYLEVCIKNVEEWRSTHLDFHEVWLNFDNIS